MTATIGKKAPTFTLLDDNNTSVSLKNLHGKKIILYFYPKDDTPGCTREACDFRDQLNHLTSKNTVVIGISKDNPSSHQKFKQKYNLTFPLLADEDGKICEAYGVIVEKNNFGKKYMGIERSTFLIDEQGIIIDAWRNVKVDGHIDAVLKKLS